MTIHASHVYLYAADKSDYQIAETVGLVCGISSTNVIGDFREAWQFIADGANLVIAIGTDALNALYYNECGWANPAGTAKGHTPFTIYPAGAGVDTVTANTFVNAAGYSGIDTLKLGVMLTYYATHGVFPQQMSGLPRQAVPRQVCPPGASPSIGAIHNVTRPTAKGGVGVYAEFNSTSAVTNAVSMGWPGIGCTSALGIPGRPYTSVLASAPDKLIGDALMHEPGVWWLSFWTVSWPANGDSFHQGGFLAGQFAAQTILSYQSTVVPDYVIVDPEGYNTPPTTSAQWLEWLKGWQTGIESVSNQLKPGFYCNQSQYTEYNLSSAPIPAFIAVSPISGNQPTVQGKNILGYIAYYASCPPTAQISEMQSWGGEYSTVQFLDSGVDCAP